MRKLGKLWQGCSSAFPEHQGAPSFPCGKEPSLTLWEAQTRRLGVRGASRYHYCGIRPANSLEAETLARLTKAEASAGSGEDASTDSNSPEGGADGPSARGHSSRCVGNDEAYVERELTHGSHKGVDWTTSTPFRLQRRDAACHANDRSTSQSFLSL
jgi:hypothetical protein